MLWKQGDNVVVNSMLHQQGDTMLFIYQSCHAIVNQDDSHYTWLTLLRFYLRIWLSPSWILPIAANAFLASVPYQKNEQFQERWRWQSLSHLLVIPVDTLSLSHNHTYHTLKCSIFK
jgi:hypothetical protein